MAKFLQVSFFSILAAVSYSSASGSQRDPTRPLSYSNSVGVKSAPVLQAIIVRDANRMAIINGKTLREGEKFKGNKIIRIADKYVLYIAGGVEKKLTLRRTVFNGS